MTQKRKFEGGDLKPRQDGEDEKAKPHKDDGEKKGDCHTHHCDPLDNVTIRSTILYPSKPQAGSWLARGE